MLPVLMAREQQTASPMLLPDSRTSKYLKAFVIVPQAMIFQFQWQGEPALPSPAPWHGSYATGRHVKERKTDAHLLKLGWGPLFCPLSFCSLFLGSSLGISVKLSMQLANPPRDFSFSGHILLVPSVTPRVHLEASRTFTNLDSPSPDELCFVSVCSVPVSGPTRTDCHLTITLSGLESWMYPGYHPSVAVHPPTYMFGVH